MPAYRPGRLNPLSSKPERRLNLCDRRSDDDFNIPLAKVAHELWRRAGIGYNGVNAVQIAKERN